MFRRSYLFPVIAGAALFFLPGCGSDSDSDDGSGSSQALEILDPAQPHYGKTHAEWGAAWWKWNYENPGPKHPLGDTTGADCDVNQPAEVFYLVGSLGGAVTRTCTVPKGKALFFPLINVAADNAGVPVADQMTEEQLKEFAGGAMDVVTSIQLELDGKSAGATLADYSEYLGALTPFSYTVPDTADNFYRKVFGLDFAGKVDSAYTRGYWMMIAPPAAGAHTIHLKARAEPPGSDPFELEVTYNLTIQ